MSYPLAGPIACRMIILDLIISSSIFSLIFSCDLSHLISLFLFYHFLFFIPTLYFFKSPLLSKVCHVSRYHIIHVSLPLIYGNATVMFSIACVTSCCHRGRRHDAVCPGGSEPARSDRGVLAPEEARHHGIHVPQRPGRGPGSRSSPAGWRHSARRGPGDAEQGETPTARLMTSSCCYCAARYALRERNETKQNRDLSKSAS